VLLDKTGILDGVAFLGRQPAQEVQVETLRRQIYWFWHDLSHFTVAMGRGQLWWAQGQLEALRGYCVNLARLRDDPADPDVGREPYFKVENAIPAGDLGPLQATFGPIERRVLLQSALGVIDFYRELASQLAERHGISYPAELERVMLARLQRLG
jgi:hypothetical protein